MKLHSGQLGLYGMMPMQESAPLCHRILELSPDSFARLGVEPCHDVKTFRMPPPPVPLFRVAV